MRLTLRTLLAYLDDTLPASEIKQIGQKVAESDAAQELIARIKQVTRRRRLTTPPTTGPGAGFDPNVVAEYLDNELSAEQVAELEKTCLESDVNLAEIAACHQILTLVLGEPALVPPTARERMYGLVRGREAIPFRKAAANRAGDDLDGDTEEVLLPLSFFRRSRPWLRWALPVAGLLLLVGVGVALYLAIPRPQPRQVASSNNTNTETKNTSEGDANKKPEKESDGNTQGSNNNKPDKSNGSSGKKPGDGGTRVVSPKQPGPPDAPSEPVDPVRVNPNPNDNSPPLKRPSPPSTQRADMGTLVTPRDALGPPAILVSREREEDGWQRVRPSASVFSNSALVSLPGYASEVHLRSGVNLLLRGYMPVFVPPGKREFAPLYLLMESAATLHKPEKGIDADLTLQRGRLYISNGRDSGPVTVRLRILHEVWDLKLQGPDTEVAVDLMQGYTRDADWAGGEEPEVNVGLYVTQGKVSLRFNMYHPFELQSPPGEALVIWDNKHGGVPQVQGVRQRIPGQPHIDDLFAKRPPMSDAVKQMYVAMKGLADRMVPPKSPLDALLESRDEKDNPAPRMLAIACFGALGEVKQLVEALGDESPQGMADREEAIITLRHWLGHGPDQHKKLYDEKSNTGVLKEMNYRSNDAKLIIYLLHGLPSSPETFNSLAAYLTQQPAIAELAFWNLVRLSGPVRLPPMVVGNKNFNFNAAAPEEDRRAFAEKIRKMVDDGKLPPPVPGEKPKTPPKGKPKPPGGSLDNGL